MKTTAIAALTAAVLAAPVFASTPVIWNEAIDGDLSNDGFNTTDLGTLNLGVSAIVGTMGAGLASLDADYFSFTIAAGQQLEAIFLSSYIPESGLEEASFIALQAGPQVTTEFDASQFLGSSLIGTNNLGTDVLDDIGADLFGGNGFTGPLGPGTYSIWWQETGTIVDYSFDFVVVPAPSAAFGLIAGAAFVSRRRR